ncbi:MAG: putative photosynthetic complex assembly protein PuhE [Pseudomonadota bacterium]
MTSPWIAGLAALFLWWFSTGAILMVVRWADQMGPRATRLATWLALPVLIGGVAAFGWSLGQATVEGAYVAFLATLAIWGWIELAFLTGQITGPVKHPCPPRTQEWERFIRAWGTIAYHEMLLAAVFLAMGALAKTADNPVGFYAFAILFLARISAKLNLYMGVPRINTEFLSRSLAHLPSHFRQARMNAVFPVSVTLLTFATACWLERMVLAPNSAEMVGYALLTALTALALLEHWFMVVPLPDAKLWRWLLPAPAITEDKT